MKFSIKQMNGTEALNDFVYKLSTLLDKRKRTVEVRVDLFVFYHV